MLEFGKFDSVWVSTDHDGIAECAMACGAKVLVSLKGCIWEESMLQSSETDKQKDQIKSGSDSHSIKSNWFCASLIMY